ncbi:hypothetical protein Gotur_019575, partial [Gossypium turneri]
MIRKIFVFNFTDELKNKYS